MLASEFLVTLCEARDKAPGMVRKLPNFVSNLFEALMGFLLDIEDEPLWHEVGGREGRGGGEGGIGRRELMEGEEQVHMTFTFALGDKGVRMSLLAMLKMYHAFVRDMV